MKHLVNFKLLKEIYETGKNKNDLILKKSDNLFLVKYDKKKLQMIILILLENIVQLLLIKIK